MSKPTHGSDTKERRTPAQRDDLLRKFHESGLTQAEFCRRHRLHPATLSAWLRREPLAESAPAFQEFHITRPCAPLEVQLPGGTVLRVGDPAWLTPLLRALRESAPC